MEGDHTVISAWALAIPSAITALSTWYTKRKVDKSDVKTGAAVDAASEALAKRVKALEETVKPLVDKVEETRTCQVQISHKHSETMSEVHSVLKDLVNRKPAAKDVVAEVADVGKVTKVDQPPQSLGKVIVKP